MNLVQATLPISATEMTVSILDQEGNKLMSAYLPDQQGQPRVLWALLEGLALWSQAPLSIVISVGELVLPSLDSTSFRGWLEEGGLALFHFDDHGQGRKIKGIGNFQFLYGLAKRGAR